MDGWMMAARAKMLRNTLRDGKVFPLRCFSGGGEGIGVDEVLHFLRSMEPRYFSCY